MSQEGGWAELSEAELSSELLIGWVHGTLTEAELERVELALKEQPELARTARALCDQSPPADGRAPRILPALAAAALLTVVLVITLTRTSEDPVSALLVGDFDRAAAELLPEGMSTWPPDPKMRSPRNLTGPAAANELLLPSKLSFGAPREIRWRHAPDAGPFTLTLSDENDEVLKRWRADRSPARMPDVELLPGRSFLLVISEQHSPREMFSGAFSIADQRDIEGLAAILAGHHGTGPDERFVRARHRIEAGDRDGAALLLEELFDQIGWSTAKALLESEDDGLRAMAALALSIHVVPEVELEHGSTHADPAAIQ